jgi:uncharacterized membrane protein
MDFAPYQDTAPEVERSLSPPPGRRSTSFSPPLRSPFAAPKVANSWAPDDSAHSGSTTNGNGGFGNDISGFGGDAERGRLNEFDTSLPLRLDYEACLAYLLLPPAGGVLLLLFEWKSDYVRYVELYLMIGIAGWKMKADILIYRFHAWQSSLLFSAIFVLHLIFCWSAFLSWILFVGDIALIAWLTMRAYKDGMAFCLCVYIFWTKELLTCHSGYLGQMRGPVLWTSSKQDSGRRVNLRRDGNAAAYSNFDTL